MITNRIAHLLSSKQPKATMPPLQPILIRLVGNRSMWKNADPDLLATAASIRVAACVVGAEVLMAAPVAKDEGAFQKTEAAAASPLAAAAGISLHGAVEDRLSQHDRRGMSTGAIHFHGQIKSTGSKIPTKMDGVDGLFPHCNLHGPSAGTISNGKVSGRGANLSACEQMLPWVLLISA